MERCWIVAALALCGCPSAATGGFSSGPGGDAPEFVAELPAAPLFAPYQARVLLEPEAAASFAVTGGALPVGLELREDGLVRGEPSWLGVASFTITATLASGATVDGDATLEVVPGEDDVFAGFARAPWFSYAGTAFLTGLWVRIGGTGEDQSTVTFDPGLYVAGPDGLFEGGLGDDVRVGDLEVGVDAGLGVGQWNPADATLADQEPSWDPETATFTAGAQTGSLSLSFSADGYVPTATFLDVVPPDWCPEGEHERGGPSPGVCE